MTANRQLCAGVARATVTPAVGIDMQGFAGRGPATGVHDDLYVTALVLASGESKAAIVAADLIGFSAEFTAAVREEVERRTGIPAASVALCASHTHYGPTTTAYDKEPTADARAYVENLRHLIAGAIQEAAEDMKPVRVGVARGQCNIGINRRERKPDGTIVLGKNPTGPIDRELIVVRLETADGEPLAALVSFAVHGVCQSSQTRTISADFVASMRGVVEPALGAKTLYLQGACGNINPILMEASFDPAHRLGTTLGGAVLVAYDQAQTRDATTVATASSELEFPTLTYESEDKAREAVEKIRGELDGLKAQNAAENSIAWAERRLERATAALASLETGTRLEPVIGEVMSMRFGDVALAMGPGEIFNQIGVAIEQQSPIADTMFVGYSNGAIGYMPVPEAYPHGGYEVERACRIGHESAGMLIDEALRQLRELARP